MEGGLQAGQRLQRSVGARAFIHLEMNFGALRLRSVGSRKADRHSDDLVFELARFDRRHRLLVAVEGKLVGLGAGDAEAVSLDRKSTRLNSSHQIISYAVFCLKKKKNAKYIRLVHVSARYVLLSF